MQGAGYKEFQLVEGRHCCAGTVKKAKLLNELTLARPPHSCGITVGILQCNSIQFEKCCNLIGPVLTTELNYIVKCPQCNMVVAQRNQKTIEQVKPKVKQHHQL